MFVSDPLEEVFTTIGKVDPHYRSWPRVDTSETFFQVHTRIHLERTTNETCLLSTARAFLDYLTACATDNAVTIQQIVITTAPHDNRSRHWKSEPLIKVEVSVDELGIPNRILYHTPGRCYSERKAHRKGELQLKTVYQARRVSPSKSSSPA